MGQNAEIESPDDDQLAFGFGDEFAFSVLAVIEQYGIQIMAISGDDETIPFFYTIGLTAAQHPELVLVGGLHSDAAQVVLNDLAARILTHGQRFEPGDQPADLLGGGYEAVICGPAGDRDYPINIARAVYGDQISPPLQVVYQDKQHRWPWQDGYACSQPLIAPRPARIRPVPKPEGGTR